jgi:cyanate permease
MGHGLAKVCMPVMAATLMLYVGWRGSWVVFGVFALLLVVAPALLFMRRSPEEMGLLPDGGPVEVKEAVTTPQKRRYAKRTGADNVEWSRREALRTPVFWLIASTFGVAQIGVTGLNLHVFSYVTDLGHPTLVAASVMSIIAVMQFSTPIVWGMLADRMDNGILNMAKCAFQGAGLLLALSLPGMAPLYAGFFIYGIGMGGTAVLAETIWADFFGRISLGKIRGMGSLVTSLFSASGPPFFGLLFDYTESYYLSFSIFIGMLFTSAVLSLCLRPPTKRPGLAA